MSDFVTKINTLTAPPLDPHKHVNYALGMVLGVDDFRQEFAYLSERGQWLARDLLGYGTVCGLQVSREDGSGGPRINVAPGVALSPRGQLIHVTPAQCALLNDWLAANQSGVVERIGSPLNAEISLFITLCYRDCLTDAVPIAGEPCRTAEESVAASRIVDGHCLTLRFVAPNQREEDAVRDFVAWCRQVEVSDDPGYASLEEFIEAIRSAALGLTSPIASPLDFMAGSPLATLHIHPDDVCDFWRAAFRIWVTELRPIWGSKACGMPPDEECLLLAEVRVPLVQSLNGQWIVDSGREIIVDEERRPFVVHLRMLQEWLLCGGKMCDLTLASPLPSPISPPAPGTITISPTVVTETTFGQPSVPGVSADPSAGDHTHGTPPDPIPPHRAAADAHTVGGDVTGNIGATTVGRLLNRPVNITGAQSGQALIFRNNEWRVEALPSAPPPPPPITISPTVVAETTFDQPSAPGASTNPSAGDHTHGTPPDPIPPHQAAPDAHTLAGDVTGNIGTNTVQRLVNRTVNMTGAQNGNVLTLRNNEWRVEAIPAPPAGNNPIVASGCFDGNGAIPSFPPFFTTNGLQAQVIANSGLIRIYLLRFTGFDIRRRYVVKGTPLNSFAGGPQFFDVVTPTDERVLALLGLTNPSQLPGIAVRMRRGDDNTPLLGFMVEISDFGPGV